LERGPARKYCISNIKFSNLFKKGDSRKSPVVAKIYLIRVQQLDLVQQMIHFFNKGKGFTARKLWRMGPTVLYKVVPINKNVLDC